MMEWQPIETAPKWSRVIVAGWQPKSGKVQGYWWWHEDDIDGEGIPINHSDALIWHEPLPTPAEPPK